MTGIVTKSLTRRALLRRGSQLGFMGAAAPLAMELASAGEAAAQAASGDDYRALVCVFLYGGNDHGNTLIPYDRANYSRYAAIRGSLAFRRELLRDTVLEPRVAQTLTDDQRFALAPYCPRLKVLFDSGKLAVQLNVGALVTPLTLAEYNSPDRAKYPLPPKLFSHNDQQSFWQALGSEGSTIGWGGRLGDLALSSNAQALLTCISASGNAVFVSGREALQYQVSPTGAIPFRPIKRLPWATPVVSAALEQLVTRPSAHVFENELARLAQRSMAMEGVVNGALDKVTLATSFDPVPGENPLADQLRIVARLIGARDELGSKRQVFFVSLDEFDHHNDLGPKHAKLMAQVDEAIAAFYMATVELGVAQQVTTFTASDFGRTLVSNSDGSDHGWGSHHFVVGGAVRGGRYYGTAPHMSVETEDQVGQGRLLPSTAIDQYVGSPGTELEFAL